MTTRRQFQWHPISTAPRNAPVELRMADEFGPYRLGFACVLGEEGWINAEFQTKLMGVPTEWRQWSGSVPRRHKARVQHEIEAGAQ